MKVVVYIFVLLLLGCSDNENWGGTFDKGVQLRIVNSSNVDFDTITVASGGPAQEFGSLKSGETSRYLNFDGIYRYGYVRIIAEGKKYILQPIDYVGEQRYERGDYSYILTIEDPDVQWSVGLRFRED